MSDAVTSALKIDQNRRASHEMLADIKSWFQSLTTREQQVMSLITVGLLNKQCSGDIGIRKVTFKSTAVRC